MGGLRLGPLSAEVVAKIITKYRPDMPALRIDNNPILAQGMRLIAEMLKSNDDIREFHARYCAIGPEGTRALAGALRVNTSIEYVSILGNQIADEGAYALIEVIPICNLKQLELQDNLISPNVKVQLEAACMKKQGLTWFI